MHSTEMFKSVIEASGGLQRQSIMVLELCGCMISIKTDQYNELSEDWRLALDLNVT